jgi:hypothetical protein
LPLASQAGGNTMRRCIPLASVASKSEIPMSQSITTKFSHGERGPFITARASGGIRKRFPYDHAMNDDGNHSTAAMALAQSLSWRGKWVSGALDTTGARIWVCLRDVRSVDEFEVLV